MPLFECAESDFEINIFDFSVHLPTRNPHENDEKLRNFTWKTYDEQSEPV